MPSLADPDRLRPAVEAVVREAGALALPFFRPGARTTADVWSKTGGSPVTEADVAVDTFLKIRLSEIEPDAAWLSEETRDDPVRLRRSLVWVVDPIDGTRAFLSGNPDWSIAVALLRDGEPILGIVYAPVPNRFYLAIAGAGATRDGELITAVARDRLSGARVAGPRTLVERLSTHGEDIVTVEKIPSLALRIARVADGEIDLGLISANARDWDLAAADLVLREAGGTVTGLDGALPRYNRPDPVHGELVAAPRGLHRVVLDAMRP
jgi:myo-inositol-1(or 4)-monophosphatase